MSIPLIWPISEPTLPAFTTKQEDEKQNAKWNKTIHCLHQNPIHWAQIAKILKTMFINSALRIPYMDQLLFSAELGATLQTLLSFLSDLSK